jgi:hypothetical protein
MTATINATTLEQSLFEVETYGFTILDAVLDSDQVKRLRDLGAQLEAGEHGEDSQFRGQARHLSNLVTRDPAYFPLIDHPRVLPLVELLLGQDLILGSLNSRIVRPGDPEQGLHGDVPQSFRHHGRPMMVNTVWMLDDFTHESGATRVIPGSHHMAPGAPPPERTLPLVVEALGAAGSVLVFDGRTWHGGGANRGNRNRHGIFGHYRAGEWMTFQCDPHEGFDPAWLPRLNLRQKQLLRMQRGLRAPGWISDGSVQPQA